MFFFSYSHIHQFVLRIPFQWVRWQFWVLTLCETSVSAQPVSVHGTHGHACLHTQCLSHQGAEPHPGGLGGWQADHCKRGQAGGGKELAEELHRSEPGDVNTHGLSLVAPPSGPLANPPAAPARPTGVQHHIHLLQTLTPSLCYSQIWHIQIKLTFYRGLLLRWLLTKWRLQHCSRWARHHHLVLQTQLWKEINLP